MPRDKKIMTSKVWVPDINGKQTETLVTVYFDRRQDDFYVKCPYYLLPGGFSRCTSRSGNGPVEVRYPDGSIRGDRPQETLDKFVSQCNRYVKAITQKRKVVAYRVKYDDDWLFDRGIGLFLEWDTGWEVAVGANIILYKHEPPDEPGAVICNQSHLFRGERNDVQIMDWTEERETFFRGLEEALEKLKSNCRNFLGDAGKLALAIDTGMVGLMIGPGNLDTVTEGEQGAHKRAE